ncbi:MAG: hypothetical protein NT154_09725 [Verrucomicrobia bacterium]|nr:hypothetical protein [Verrucomicrobiota bacterium]
MDIPRIFFTALAFTLPLAGASKVVEPPHLPEVQPGTPCAC